MHVLTVNAQRDGLITGFDARIATLERDIATVLQEPAWAESSWLLQTIQSIGPGLGNNGAPLGVYRAYTVAYCPRSGDLHGGMLQSKGLL